MIKPKLKLCAGCDEQKIIWKNIKGKKYCKNCAYSINTKTNTSKSYTPIKKISSKKSEKDKIYSQLRKDFLNTHPFCQIRGKKCQTNSTDVHHQYDGSDRSKYYLDPTTWNSTCRWCHNDLHDNPERSKLLGYLK